MSVNILECRNEVQCKIADLAEQYIQEGGNKVKKQNIEIKLIGCLFNFYNIKTTHENFDGEAFTKSFQKAIATYKEKKINPINGQPYAFLQLFIVNYKLDKIDSYYKQEKEKRIDGGKYRREIVINALKVLSQKYNVDFREIQKKYYLDFYKKGDIEKFLKEIDANNHDREEIEDLWGQSQVSSMDAVQTDDEGNEGDNIIVEQNIYAEYHEKNIVAEGIYDFFYKVLNKNKENSDMLTLLRLYLTYQAQETDSINCLGDFIDSDFNIFILEYKKKHFGDKRIFRQNVISEYLGLKADTVRKKIAKIEKFLLQEGAKLKLVNLK